VTVGHFDDSSALPLETAVYDGPQFPPPTRTSARRDRAGRPRAGVRPEGDRVLMMTSRAADEIDPDKIGIGLDLRATVSRVN
jgi:hypothetical protein